LCKIGALFLFVKHDRFAALLDHRLQHSIDFGVRDTLGVSFCTRRNIPVLSPAMIIRTVEIVRGSLAFIAALSRSAKA